jgi:gamma-glutamyltranspeptidase/glutathione hydrolase
MGGYQAIWFVPDAGPGDPSASAAPGTGQPVAGVYRAASDHRKDGEAVGW